MVSEMNELEKDEPPKESEGNIQFPLQPLTDTEHQHATNPTTRTSNTTTTTSTTTNSSSMNKRKQQKKNTIEDETPLGATQANHAIVRSGVKHKIKRLAVVNVDIAQRYANKTVGLGAAVLAANKGELGAYQHGPIEEQEAKVRRENVSCWLARFVTTLLSSILVFMVYLITLETLMSCALSVGLTIYWYNVNDEKDSWEGSGMDWIVLGFAVVTPLTVTITLAFQRRERALIEIARVKSFCFQIYLGHTIWDWESGNGRRKAMNQDEWIKHTDQVLEHLVGIGDELTRFLTLPTSSKSYHRMLKSGRRKAANIVEVAYKLLDSLYTQRMVQISILTEKLKAMGLSATEISRMRQYERYIGEAIENLRMLKMYRTPQALRSFGRIFTLILPAVYAPAFAQLALDLHSFAMGIIFAVLTPLVLTALFQTMQVIEDPFVGWVTLDGIDVNEEMEILHFHQLISARATLFPSASPFEATSKAAIVSKGAASIDGTMSNIGGSRRHSSYFSKSVGGGEGDGMDGTNRVSHFVLDGTIEGASVASLSASARDRKLGLFYK